MTSPEDRLTDHLRRKTADADVRFTLGDVTTRRSLPEGHRTFMDQRPSRTTLLAVAALLVVGLGVGGYVAVDRSQDQAVSVDGPAAESEEPTGDGNEPATGAVGAPAINPVPTTASRCGDELPIDVTFGSDEETTADDTTSVDGVLTRTVSHLSGAGIVIAWPSAGRELYDLAAPAPEYQVEVASSEAPPVSRTIHLARQNNGVQSTLPEITVVSIDDDLDDNGLDDSEPNADASEEPGECAMVDIVAYEQGEEVYAMLWDLTAGADDSPLVENWGMITSRHTTTEPPTESISCAEPTVENVNDEWPPTGDGFASPAEALAAFLDQPENSSYMSIGLHEMIVDDDTYIYGAPFEADSDSVTTSTDFVTLFTVEQVDGGWHLTSLTSAGC